MACGVEKLRGGGVKMEELVEQLARIAAALERQNELLEEQNKLLEDWFVEWTER